ASRTRGGGPHGFCELNRRRASYADGSGPPWGPSTLHLLSRCTDRNATLRMATRPDSTVVARSRDLSRSSHWKRWLWPRPLGIQTQQFTWILGSIRLVEIPII